MCTASNPKATVVLLYVQNAAPLSIRTTFKPQNTLRTLLIHSKDRLPSSDSNRIAYQISCSVSKTNIHCEYKLYFQYLNKQARHFWNARAIEATKVS